MEDALDFVGWYNHKTWKELGIDRTDAYRLYLAYHEGRGGYRRGTWKGKPEVQRYARRVSETTRSYQSSSRAARNDSAATPGTRSGRSAADDRSRAASRVQPASFRGGGFRWLWLMMASRSPSTRPSVLA